MNTIRIVASEHPVASVMVLKSSKAEVMRTFKLALKDGRNKLIISKLPTTIEKESVRISILHRDGTPVERDVYLSDVVCSPMGNAGDDPTRRAIRALEVKKSGLQSEKKLLDTQAEVMVTYARSLTGQYASPDVIDEFFYAFGDRGRKNIEAVMKIEEGIAEIDEQIQEVQRKRTLLKGTLNTELVAVVVANSDVQAQFQLTYVVNNTKWSPSYELHAVTGKDGKPSRTVSLHYHASIKQATGEDWTDASLTLSTVATDTIVRNIPTLEPVKVSSPPTVPPPRIVQEPEIYHHQPIIIPEPRTYGSQSRAHSPPGYRNRGPTHTRASRRYSSSYSSRRRSRSRSRSPSPARRHVHAQHIIPNPAPVSFRVAPDFGISQGQSVDDGVLVLSDDEEKDEPDWVEETRRGREVQSLVKMVTQTPMTLTYAVRGKSDIPSDGKEHIVTIAVLTFEADVEYVSVPRIDPRVFLQCQVKNTSEYRLLPGPVSVIMDKNYVSRTRFSNVNRNDTFTFTLGDDPSITISYERLSKVTKEGTHAFAEPIDITTYTTTTTVHNTHQFAIQKLAIRDAVPVSVEKRIKVVLRKPQELIEAEEGVFVEVNDGGEATGAKGSNDKGEEGLRVKWEKEQDGLYEYKWRIGAEDKTRFETVFEVKGPADMKYLLSNFDIRTKNC